MKKHLGSFLHQCSSGVVAWEEWLDADSGKLIVEIVRGEERFAALNDIAFQFSSESEKKQAICRIIKRLSRADARRVTFGAIDWRERLSFTSKITDGHVIADVFESDKDETFPFRLAFCKADGEFTGLVGAYWNFKTRAALNSTWDELVVG